MTPGPDPGGSSPSRSLRDRLAAFSRYATLVREQIDALRGEDLQRFDELAQARDRVQAELDSLPGRVPSPHALGPEEQELLASLTNEVREALARDKELRSLLAGKRADAAGALKAMAGREGKLRRYLDQEEPAPRDAPPRLNVRL